jgi:hypothetical protein
MTCTATKKLPGEKDLGIAPEQSFERQMRAGVARYLNDSFAAADKLREKQMAKPAIRGLIRRGSASFSANLLEGDL